VGALRTSEDDVVVAGEGTQVRTHEDRAVDAGEAKIIIAPGPVSRPATVAPVLRPLPQRALSAQPTTTGGRWLVILVYILATAALAAAIYERYVL
jgi:hypothetical protein